MPRKTTFVKIQEEVNGAWVDLHHDEWTELPPAEKWLGENGEDVTRYRFFRVLKDVVCHVKQSRSRDEVPAVQVKAPAKGEQA